MELPLKKKTFKNKNMDEDYLCNQDLLDKLGNEIGYSNFWFNYDDVEKAVNNTYERLNNVLPLKCIKNENDPDNCSCIACVRDTMRNEVKRIINDEFGFAVSEVSE